MRLVGEVICRPTHCVKPEGGADDRNQSWQGHYATHDPQIEDPFRASYKGFCLKCLPYSCDVSSFSSISHQHTLSQKTVDMNEEQRTIG